MFCVISIYQLKLKTFIKLKQTTRKQKDINLRVNYLYLIETLTIL